MANIEWNIPFDLISPEGTLALNAEDDDRYILVPHGCSMGVSKLRVTTDEIPQGDGGNPHDTWRSFYEVNLLMQLWQGPIDGGVPACGAERRRMFDTLMLHLNALVRPSKADADAGLTRLTWEPTFTADEITAGMQDDRMVNRLTIVEYGPPADDGEGAVEIPIKFQSPYPYAMSVTEQQDEVDGTVTIHNPGTAEFYPVVRMDGELTVFNIDNNTTGTTFAYDFSRPGAEVVPAGHYVEIDSFGETMFLDGNSTNLMAGLDVEDSDFVTLVPGDNEIFFDQAATILWNWAWA